MPEEFEEFLNWKFSLNSSNNTMSKPTAMRKKSTNDPVRYSTLSLGLELPGRSLSYVYYPNQPNFSYSLIAILLVVFGMTALEASVAMAKINKDLFANPNMKPEERNTFLKKCIEHLLKSHNMPLNATLLDTSQYSKGCRL
jgi:hypothetical protein